MTSYMFMFNCTRFFGQQTSVTTPVLYLPFVLGKGLSYVLFGCSDSAEAM